jgi:aspartate/methionine/tyrosine aminotransferase
VTVSRLLHIPGLGVDAMGDAADAANDPDMLRLENLDTDIRPPQVAVATTRRVVDDDRANSYLPFQGHWRLREAAAAHVGRIAGQTYDPRRQSISVAGGLNGITNSALPSRQSPTPLRIPEPTTTSPPPRPRGGTAQT